MECVKGCVRFLPVVRLLNTMEEQKIYLKEVGIVEYFWRWNTMSKGLLVSMTMHVKTKRNERSFEFYEKIKNGEIKV
jgi:hypothetical protein